MISDCQNPDKPCQIVESVAALGDREQVQQTCSVCGSGHAFTRAKVLLPIESTPPADSES